MKTEKLVSKVTNYVLRKVGKCLGDYQMIDNGDRILVGVSGGKDSITLIDALAEKRRVLPVKFMLYTVRVEFTTAAVNLDNNLEVKIIDDYLKSITDGHFVIRQNLPETTKKLSCFWCSWNRRKQIFLLAKKLNCRKVALGHTLDDIVVTFLMNLFYHGEISTMPPKVVMFNGEIVLIRPLTYVSEKEVVEYIRAKNLPVKQTMCPVYDTEKQFQRRKYLKELIDQLSQYWPNIRMNIFNSLKRVKDEYLV
ncbi:MAG: hypothetical protein N2555_06070 [Endomicrobia bacterium]|nr:hypothetical protein [Endomicrobiia bacterium]